MRLQRNKHNFNKMNKPVHNKKKKKIKDNKTILFPLASHAVAPN